MTMPFLIYRRVGTSLSQISKSSRNPDPGSGRICSFYVIFNFDLASLASINLQVSLQRLISVSESVHAFMVPSV